MSCPDLAIKESKSQTEPEESETAVIFSRIAAGLRSHCFATSFADISRKLAILSEKELIEVRKAEFGSFSHGIDSLTLIANLKHSFLALGMESIR
uniref:Uncharacterized protein n=1 Tax=Magallana gigas TaxID=29159 RepID=K1QRX5_MAGGI